MLTKSFSLAAVVALAGSVVWIGCSSDDPPANNPSNVDAGGGNENDAGSGETDSGNEQPKDDGGEKDAGFDGVDITYGKCPDFTKCGGDVAGSWKVKGGCVPDDAFADLKETCQGLVESDVVIKANGTVVATATTIDRKTNIHVSAKLAIPKSCSPVPDCSLIASGLESGFLPGAPKFEKATCTDSGTSCNCDVNGTFSEQANDEYTTSNDVLTTKDPERTFDYCVKDSALTYRETTAPAQGQFTLPIIAELTK